jgi:hypothetical protein
LGYLPVVIEVGFRFRFTPFNEGKMTERHPFESQCRMKMVESSWLRVESLGSGQPREIFHWLFRQNLPANRVGNATASGSVI